jgi:cysteinyl-tRNA synthetase
MGKSLGNAIPLDDFFAGNHSLLEKPYSPMIIRFFMLQAHYRSTVDFSNEALQAAEKGLKRLMNGIGLLGKVLPAAASTVNVEELRHNCYAAMDDDFNTPVVLAHLFDGIRLINLIHDGKETISSPDLELLGKTYHDFVFDILGLKPEEEPGHQEELIGPLMDTILALRQKARENKDWSSADMIRDALNKLKIQLKDTKEGAVWEVMD